MILPLAAFLIIDKVRTGDGVLYSLKFIYIDTGLKEESLRIHVCLPTVVVVESIVVRASDRQFVLEGVIAVSDVVNHLLKPRLVGQVIIFLEVIYVSQSSVRLLSAIKRNLLQFYFSHSF
jgi:hypothetical protein